MNLVSTAEEWLEAGVENGWCSPPVCQTHDGVPMSVAEEAEWENGDDPCQVVVRIDSWTDEPDD